jgi:hypothetical protein
VEHPQEGKDNFFTKLKGQMESASASAKRADGGDDLGTSPFPNEYQNIYEAATGSRGVVYVR